jgi:hypothetical protein
MTEGRVSDLHAQCRSQRRLIFRPSHLIFNQNDRANLLECGANSLNYFNE